MIIDQERASCTCFVSSRSFLLFLFLFAVMEARAEPIHDAVESGSTRLVREIIKENPSALDARTAGGATPLHLAVGLNEYDLTEILLSLGANVNARTKEGYSPLHWAAHVNSDIALGLLITAGGDAVNQTPNGRTPRDVAAARGSRSCEALLEGYEALHAGNADAAYTLFECLAKDRPTNSEISLALGLAAYDAGRFPEALASLERRLQTKAGSGIARLFIARSYLAMENYEVAMAKFDRLLVRQLPEDVRNSVLADVRSIRDATREQGMNLHLRMGFAASSDARTGPDPDIVTVAPVMLGTRYIDFLALATSAAPSSASSLFGSLMSEYYRDIGDEDGWILDARLAAYGNRMGSDDADYESTFIGGSLGLRRAVSSGIFRIPLRFEQMNYGGSDFMTVVSASPSYLYSYGDKDEWQLLFNGSLESRNYSSLEGRQGLYVSYGVNARRFFGDTDYTHALFVGISFFNDGTDEPIDSSEGKSWNVGAELKLPLHMRVYARLEARSVKYPEAGLAGQVVRSDSRQRYSVGVSRAFGDRLGCDISYDLADNNSSLDQHDYDRSVLTLSLSSSF